ncbi:MAG: hypothetical protein P8Y09_03635 [Deltaproteobacteria bacterium]|jgi:hypothetical protein
MNNTVRNIGILFFLLILPLLLGCPYESGVPLSKSSKADIDQSLLGAWKNTAEGEPFTMIIEQFNDHELLLLGMKDDKIERDVMRAFVTVIEDERFLNVQEIKESPDERGWYLVHYALAGDTLTMWIVDDKLFTKPFTSSRALSSFVKKNLSNKDLYGDIPPMVLQRVEE